MKYLGILLVFFMCASAQAASFVCENGAVLRLTYLDKTVENVVIENLDWVGTYRLRSNHNGFADDQGKIIFLDRALSEGDFQGVVEFPDHSKFVCNADA